MYDVTPEVRAHWHALLRSVARDADIAIECIAHAAPAPLRALWERADLALAFMCGFPLATRYPDARPLAAPVTAVAKDDAPTYFAAWLVRANSGFASLASTFGHRIGWLAAHSHSGFNAPRHALLAHRTRERPLLFRASVGPLGHPRAALAALRDGRIDVTAIDAYWWWLLRRHDAGTAAQFREVGGTDAAPMPPLIRAAALPDAGASRLVAALARLHEDARAGAHLDALGVRAFVPAARADYGPLAAFDRDAHAAGYPLPA
jgi:ABC-type phosphate/phosphonate transport system substrate-binding protein